MQLLKFLAASALSFALVSAAWAETYSATLSRKDSNIYETNPSSLIIKTKYCYEYASYDDSLIDTDRRTVYFKDSRETCDLDSVYRPVHPSSGRYKAEVSREDGNWYRTDAGLYLKTENCLELALSEEVSIRLTSFGSGHVKFDNGNTCGIDGVYQKLSL
ncbi:hypothetical protein MUN46_009420 [Mesosutterella sp. AGMB02718]|uniref:Uncharacterized protein n=1 Tax=Mesosutterella faecium TaxID=2925194 RepID=A0ABT7IQH7_9BURK|nr:hypothetical protein [Mesosutterella sp. AGMB02718]MDL2060153.1 hypothetical protein [Mesosutterella sp. AGMB02718]